MTQTGIQSVDKGKQMARNCVADTEQLMMEDDALSQFFKMRHMLYIGALLPGFGIYFCIAYSYMFQWDRVEHFRSDNCENVHSWFPPVSYTIGVWEPQKFFWLFIMFIHFPPRVAFLVLFPRLFLGNVSKSTSLVNKSCSDIYKLLSWCFIRSMWMEPFGLLLLSIVDINTNFFVHSFGFMIWLVAFNCNMFCNIVLHKMSTLRRSEDMHGLMLGVKIILFIIGVTLSVSTAFSYPYFVTHCSQTAYLLFSVAEYSLVGFNCVFYCIVYFQFPKMQMSIGVYRMYTLEIATIVRADTEIEKATKAENSITQEQPLYILSLPC